MCRRIFGLRPVLLLPSRLFGFNPSRLRADAFFRGGGGAWPSPATRSLAPHEYCRTGTAGLARLAPRRTGRGLWGYAPACCGRLHESVPCSTLTVRCLCVMKDGSPTHHLASMWIFHATHQACGRKLWQERSYLVAGALTWPRQGTSR